MTSPRVDTSAAAASRRAIVGFLFIFYFFYWCNWRLRVNARIRLFFANRVSSIKFVIYRDWQCCLLAKYYRFYSTDRIARRTLLDYASDPLTFKEEEFRATVCTGKYGGNKSAHFNKETRHVNFCNKRNQEIMCAQNEIDLNLSVHSLNCNVNRGSFAIIVHCTRAFCLKKRAFVYNLPVLSLIKALRVSTNRSKVGRVNDTSSGHNACDHSVSSQSGFTVAGEPIFGAFIECN